MTTREILYFILIAAGIGLALVYFSNFIPKFETAQQNAARVSYEAVGAAQVKAAGGEANYQFAPTGFSATA
jgi:hypothetical protein